MRLPSKFTALVCCIVLIVLAGAGTTLRGQTGGFAYVANGSSNNVSAYAIDGTTGALTPVVGSPFPAGEFPYSVTVDPTGRFAYVANRYSYDVSAYTIDGTTGALTPVAGSPFPAGLYPDSVTTDPTGQFAYVANQVSNDVSAYTIDGITGALTPVAGTPFPAGTEPLSVTVDPTGKFAYVANCGIVCFGGSGPGNVSAYTIDATTGALTPVVGSPFPAGAAPSSVTTTAGPQPIRTARVAVKDHPAWSWSPIRQNPCVRIFWPKTKKG